MYIVKYQGDLNKDPLNHGVVCFEDPFIAIEHLDKMRSKGYNAEAYACTHLDNESMRLKALEELTAEAQELGLYD